MKTRFHQALAALAVILPAQAAVALEAEVDKEVNASPDKVWEVIGEFCDIKQWHPAIAKCELSGKGNSQQRHLTLQDGAMMVEQQVTRKDSQHLYSYTIVDGPLPLENYQSTIMVTPSGRGSLITWTGSFDASGAPDTDVVNLVKGIYQAGVDGIAAKAEK